MLSAVVLVVPGCIVRCRSSCALLALNLTALGEPPRLDMKLEAVPYLVNAKSGLFVGLFSGAVPAD